MATKFTTTKKDYSPIEFEIDDEHFVFTPHKQASMILPLMDPDSDMPEAQATKAFFDWLGEGLPEEQLEVLIDRLKDPKDQFDTEDLAVIARGLMEEVNSQRPPTSRSGSSRSPSKTGPRSTAGASRKGSRTRSS